MSDMPLGMTSAPDTPNSTRNRISEPAFQAIPHSAVVTIPPARPHRNTVRLPRMSPSLPASGVTTAMASIRPVTTQPSVARLVCRSTAIDASETVTIVISEPKPITASITTSRSWWV